MIAIELPPLRGRPGDVETLAWHFLGEFSRDVGRHREGFSAPALERLRSHAWPGNVRELRNVIERAVLLSDGAQIEAADLQLEVRPQDPEGWAPDLPGGGLALAEIERAVVLEALERTGFVQKEAADLLRISRRKLNYKVQSMGITHPSWRRNRGDDS